jgi:hypothetical protein
MFGNVSGLVVGVIGGVIALAVTAVIVSKNANTAGVVSAGGSALANVIGAAVSPVASGGAPSYGGASTSLGALG